jgi:putative MATE family efflux protein
MGAWATLRAAISGAPQDYTRGSLSRAILLLAIPMVLEMAMESLFGLVDVFFVSGLGPHAVATVGLTEAVLSLVYAVGLGLAMASSARVARRIGEGNPAEASRTAAQALWLTLAVAAPICLFGALRGRWILGVLGGAPEVVATGAPFTRIILGGSAVILLLFVLNGALRGAGAASAAMRVLWLANGINLILDPCLIRGLGPFPRLGLTGAAVATTVGRGLGVAYQLLILLRGRSRIRLERRLARPDLGLMGRLFQTSLGGAGQVLISSASWVALTRILAPFGSAVVAGYTVAVRMVVVALLPAWGMANAASTLVGQNLGARQPERAASAVWRSGLYNMIFLGAVALVFIAAAEKLVAPFSTDPPVVAAAVSCLRTLAYGYVFYAYGMVMMQSFNGAGDTVTPAVLNVICFWLVQAPLAYVLSTSLGWGPQGVFVAITLANSLSAVLGILAFRRGTWKQRQV